MHTSRKTLNHVSVAVVESIRAALEEEEVKPRDAIAAGIEPLQPIDLSLDFAGPSRPVDDFIGIVRRIEQDLGDPLNRSTRHMITVFRKVFYDNVLWNFWMIPGTWTIDQIISGDDREKLLEARDAMTDGTASDLGHTLVGMDAANHPGCIPPHLIPTEHAATWLGDLGSILTSMYHAVRTNPPATDEEMRVLWQQAIERESPGIDLLGDIDGLVAGHTLSIGSAAAGMTVSDLLHQYYWGTSAGTAIESRLLPATSALAGL